MTEHSRWESMKTEGSELIDRIKGIIHEGNVRRIRIRQGKHVVAEFPLTVGVVGTVAAPIMAAVGALTALLTDCSIEIERIERPADERSDDHGTAEGFTEE
jgi:hypothetical protein